MRVASFIVSPGILIYIDRVVAHPRVLAWHRTFDKTVPADDSIPDFDDDDIEFENELEMDDQDLAAYHNFH